MIFPMLLAPWLANALSRLQSGQSLVLATVVGPPSHPYLGRHMLVDPRVPCQVTGDQLPVFDKPAWNDAAAAVAEERTAVLLSLKLEDRKECDPLPNVRVFMAWCGPPPEAWIFGAGHIAQALSPLLSKLGWRVVVCDDREEFVTLERFPDASEHRIEDFARSARACATRGNAWAVLVTRGHQHDERILRELHSGQPRYAGMIGSQRRVGTVRKRLASEGLPSQFLDALHAPIGLSIQADSPMEIAVSIAGEMIAVRRGATAKSALPGTVSAASADAFGQLELWEQVAGVLKSGRPGILATVVSRRGSTPRGLGAQMAIYADGSTTGTIGGGCGEGAVLRAAKEMIVSGTVHRLVDVDLTGDDTAESSDVCGGQYSVFLEMLS